MAQQDANQGNPLLTFSRASEATYWDKNGVLQIAGINEQREDYDPLTGAYKGLLIEQEATNFIPESSDIKKWRTGDSYSVNKSDDSGLYEIRSTATTDSTGPNVTVDLSGYERRPLTISFRLKKAKSRYAAASLQSEHYPVPSRNITALYDFEKKLLTVTGSAAVAGRSFSQIIGDGSVLISFVREEVGTSTNNFIFSISPSSVEVDHEERTRGEKDSFGSVLFSMPQIESGSSASSFIFTSGKAGVRKKDSAVFKDYSLFDNFSAGALLAHFETKYLNASGFSNTVLSLEKGQGRFVYQEGSSGNIRSWDGSSVTGSFPGKPINKSLVCWGGKKFSISLNGNLSKSTDWDGSWGSGGLVLGDQHWSGWVKKLGFYSDSFESKSMASITNNDAKKIIGYAPNGGYYNYGNLDALFIESDESGLDIKERTPARVGDRVGAILDSSGHGNHLTASTDSRRGILESDGEHYWIRFTGDSQSYGCDFYSERSVSFFNAVDVEDDRSFILVAGADNQVNVPYAMIYSQSGEGDWLFNRFSFDYPRYYFNGKFRDVNQRDEAFVGLTKPCMARSLYQVTDPRNNPRRIYLNGYQNGWGLEGKSYGFAWASQLSEEESLLVEDEMRKNMPEPGSEDK